MKKIQSPGWRTIAWMAAAAAGTFACDDGDSGGGSSASLDVQFVSPASSGTAITCADDQNLETQDVIEYDVAVLVRLAGQSSEGLEAQLSLDGGEPVSQAVPASGRVTFSGFPVPVGAESPLTVVVIRGEEIIATSATSVTASFDTEDPECVEVAPTPTLSFASPADQAVFTAADDADGDLANGVQTNIRIEAENLASGTVTLTVGGAPAGSAEIDGGAATFQGVTLPISGDAEAPVALVASAETADGEPVTAEIAVTVDITECGVTITPVGGEAACDFDATADLDPDVEGVQVEIEATSTCGDVTFTVNGSDLDPVAVEDGSATARITLTEGENTVGARGSLGDALTGTAEAVTYTVDATAPTIEVTDLSPLRENVIALADGTATAEGGLTYDVTGVVAGLPEGATINAAFAPALPNFRNGDFEIGADGSFTIPVAVESYACGHTLTLTAADDCGNEISTAYEVCFDPTQPDVRLISPVGGSVFTTAQDVRVSEAAEDEGIQVEMAVTVVDDRPAEVDYDIYVECRLPGLNYSDRFTLPGDRIRRSDLVEGGGTVVVTFRGADAGNLGCRAAADASPNAAVVQEVPQDYFVVLDTPSFQLTNPTEGQCFNSGQIFVGGAGQNLADNGGQLFATFTAEGGDSTMSALVAGEDESWSVRLGVTEGTEALAEGNYSVSVAGTIVGDNPVAVLPAAPVSFVVDSTAPVLSVQSPAPSAVLLVGDDANGDLSDCIQTAFTFDVVDPNVSEVCYRLNGAAERCAAVVDGAATSIEESLLDGENALSVRAQDCAGNESTVQAAFSAVCGTPRIQVVDPADGSSVALGADLDPATEGLQLMVAVETNLPEGAQVELVQTEGGVETISPALEVNSDGEVFFPITVSVPAEAGESYQFNLQARLEDDSSAGPQITVNVRLVPPAITLQDFGGCVNGQVADASAEPGFQLAITATAERVEAGQQASLTADCGDGNPATVTGAVGANGLVTFNPITLASEATCALTASVTDAAGQPASDEGSVQVDRVAPLVGFLRPSAGQTINDFDDEDLRDLPEAAGIQVTPRVNICGAAGQTVTFTSSPDGLVGETPLTRVVGPGECSQVSMDRYTLPLGDLSFSASVADACGNTTTTPVDFVVDPGAAIVVNSPTDNATMLVGDDDDAEMAGCQINLLGQTRGLGAEAEFFVCTDVDQGEGIAGCDGQASALNGACAIQGNSAEIFECPLTLADGVHTLTVVGQFGQRVVSEPITVVADCSAPTVQTITVDQDANADACINRAERTNAASVSDRAQFQVTVNVDGVEDGRVVRVRRVGNNNELLAAGNVSNGAVTVSVDLAPGAYTLYATGADAAGNSLPAVGSAGAISRPVRVNTVVPTPSVVNLAPNTCLNAAADAEAGGQLQYGLQVTPGGEVGETLNGTVVVDGDVAGAINAQSAGGVMSFPSFSVDDGVYVLDVAVTDDCANVGTVSNVPFEVDTVAPSPIIAAPVAGSVLTAADDANGNSADGFQATASLDFADRNGIEAGQVVRVYNGNQQITTSPASIQVPAGLAGPIAATFTLPPGALSLEARATDVCGNTGVSEVVPVQVEIEGCASQLQGFEGAEDILGPSDGVQQGNTLVRDIEGAVDLLDPSCADAAVSLLADGVVIAGPVAVAGGFVTFSDVALPAGSTVLQLRASLDGTDTLSLGQSILVDIEAPSTSITTPPAGLPVLVDEDAGTPGQQITVVGQVTEGPGNSARTATLEVNGAQVAGPVAVNAANPSNITFAGVTVPSGDVTLRLCVLDAAGLQGCTSRTVTADPEAPGAIGAPNVTVTDPRRPVVEVAFTAPGDDGASGSTVTEYAVRYASAAVADEDGWELANVIGTFPGVAAPGAEETITLDAVLPLNGVYQVAVRAMDDVGRMGPIVNVAADVSLNFTEFELNARQGAWDNDTYFNTESLLSGIGDVNGDGRGDALVAALQFDAGFAEYGQATLFLAAANPADAQIVQLTVPNYNGAVFQFGLYANGIGDVNGDGLQDFSIIGIAGDYSGSIAAVYFGSADPVALAVADSIVYTPGRYFTRIAGVGNFNHLTSDENAGVNYNDFIIGGTAQSNQDYAFVIAGRATADWGASIDATVTNVATGVTWISVPGRRNIGGSVSAAGDLNNDGFGDVVISAGNSPTDWDGAYVFYGGQDLPANYAYDALEATTFRLVNPCPAQSTNFGSSMRGGVDLTGDANGLGDFIVGDRTSRRLSIWDEDQTSTDCFGRSVQNYGAIFDIAGDINNDGYDDLLTSHNNYSNNPDFGVWVYYNDGSGMFGTDGVESPRGADFIISSPSRHYIGTAGLGNFDGDANGYDDFGVVYKEPGGTLRLRIFY